MTTGRFEMFNDTGRIVSEGNAHSETGQKLARSIFLIQFAAVGTGYLLYAMNRTAFPIGLHNIAQTLGFTVAQVSTLATVFLLGQGLIGIPAGFWNSAQGKRGLNARVNALMLVSTAGAGVMSLLLAYLALSYPLTLAYRILFGMFQGAFNISVYSFAGSVLPQRRAFLNMCMGFFYATGAIIGPTAFSQIIAASPADEGWKLGLAIFGIVSIALGVVIFITIALTVRRAAPAREAKPAVLASNPVPRERVIDVVKEVLAHKPLWKGLSIHAANLLSLWGFIGLMPTFFIQYQGKSVAFVGTVFGIGFGLTSVASPLFGLIADRYGRQLVVVVLGLVDAAALYVMLYHPAGQMATMVTIFIAGAGLNSIYYLGYTLAQDGVPSRRVPIATGFAGALGYLVVGCSGPVSGWLTALYNYQVAGTLELIVPQFVAVFLALAFLPSVKTWRRLRRESLAAK